MMNARDGFRLTMVDGRAVARLSDEDVREQPSAMVDAVGSVSLVNAVTDDGSSARVTVAMTWRPPAFSVFVSEGIEVQATATTRTAFG